MIGFLNDGVCNISGTKAPSCGLQGIFVKLLKQNNGGTQSEVTS